LFTQAWSRGENPGVNTSQALNIWIIQIVIAIGPPLGGLFFTIYMKTDWGISLFFLTPLALVAIPALRLRRIALFHLSAIWLGIIGICDTTEARLPACEAWMAANAKDAEQLAITTQRFFHGHPGPAIIWKIYIVPPAK